MTTTEHTRPGITQRAVVALAALVHEIRPDWHEPGIAAEIRRHAHIPLAALGWAFLRAATDPANTTPAALSQDGNRAWDDTMPWRCRIHPQTQSRRPNGECGHCWTDRREDPDAGVIRDRGGRPMPEQSREAVDAVLSPSKTHAASKRDTA